MKSKICLVLTESTLEKNRALLEQYRNWIDIAELRVDFLEQNELLNLRAFPSQANIPVILTARRKIDGGTFVRGEATRTIILARGLAFADIDQKNNFSYVDIESDMNVPILEEAAGAAHITLIRSVHDFSGDIASFLHHAKEVNCEEQELCKFAFLASSLKEVTALIKAKKFCGLKNCITIAMGKYGIPLRILAAKFGDPIIYTAANTTSAQHLVENGMIDPVTLHTRYNIRALNAETTVYGLIGESVQASKSPALHNDGFYRKRINAVYVPISAASINEAMEFAEETNMQGLSITAPFKTAAVAYADELSAEAQSIGAINTLVKKDRYWVGYNTDASGFEQALTEFTQLKSLSGKNIGIIGAGGAARAVAYVIHRLGGNACIFNRSRKPAQELANHYGFRWAFINADSASSLKVFSDIIIQATSAGALPNIDIDPFPAYAFTGEELVFDLIYRPQKTVFLARAESAGCKIENGDRMLKYQGYIQFNLFTGSSYE